MNKEYDIKVKQFDGIVQASLYINRVYKRMAEVDIVTTFEAAVSEAIDMLFATYYNGKIVCVCSETREFTVGKIYEIKDGAGINNYGKTFPNGLARSFGDICHPAAGFIEIVE